MSYRVVSTRRHVISFIFVLKGQYHRFLASPFFCIDGSLRIMVQCCQNDYSIAQKLLLNMSGCEWPGGNGCNLKTSGRFFQVLAPVSQIK